MSEGNALDLEHIFGEDRNLLANEIATLWTQWSSASNKNKSMWSEVLRYIYATSTKETSNDGVAPWSNTTHRPKLANIFDTLTINYDAALFPNDDWLTFESGDIDSASQDKRAVVEAYLRTKHRIRASNFRPTQRRLLENFVAFGNTFAQVDYVNEMVEDPRTGLISTTYVGPKVTLIDPRDIQFNPLATSFRESPKIIRTMFTIGELHRIVQERPDQQHFKEILDRATEYRARFRQFDQGDLQKDILLQFDGFGTASEYFNSGLVEVLDFYGDIYENSTGDYRKNHVLTVVDRYDLVRDEPIDTWNGKPHIFHAGWRDRPDNLWAQGPLDNLIGLQYRIDHLENARADAFDQMIDPDILFSGDVEEIMQVGGAKHYYMPENGVVSHLRPDTTSLNADLQIQELTDAMEQFALAPREALGIRSPGEKTAFEVAELSTASGRAFQQKVNQYSEFLEDIINAELEVAVRNLDSADVVQVTDNDTGAQEFRTITKQDITANGRLVPIGARHFARNSQLIQNLSQLQLGALTDPEVAQHFSSVELANLYQELLDLNGGSKNLVAPYKRVEERLEAQRRTQAAEDTALQESLTPVAGPGDAPEIDNNLRSGPSTELNFAGLGT